MLLLSRRAQTTAGETAQTCRSSREHDVDPLHDPTGLAGVTKPTIIAIERWRVHAIKHSTIRRLSAALGVEPGDVAEFRRALSGDAPPAGQV